VMVMDETTDMVEVVRRITSFFVHESCGICTPCRLGGRRMLDSLERIAGGRAAADELAKLDVLMHGISGLTFCPMGTGMCEPVSSGLTRFRDEFEARVRS